jgi:hypothetical protein
LNKKDDILSEEIIETNILRMVVIIIISELFPTKSYSYTTYKKRTEIILISGRLIFLRLILYLERLVLKKVFILFKNYVIKFKYY